MTQSDDRGVVYQNDETRRTHYTKSDDRAVTGYLPPPTSMTWGTVAARSASPRCSTYLRQSVARRRPPGSKPSMRPCLTATAGTSRGRRQAARR